MTGITWRIFNTVLLASVFCGTSFATPAITSLSPSSGTVNSTVTITGSGFGLVQGTVKFGVTSATIISWTGSTGGNGTVVVTVPPGLELGNYNVVLTAAGAGGSSPPMTFTVITFFATLPQSWVDNTKCNPNPATGYNVTITLDGVSSTNNGPNHTGSAVGAKYDDSLASLLDAMNNWRDNGANTAMNNCTPGNPVASNGCTFTDAWWLIKVPNESTAILTGTGYSPNSALISFPGKVSGTSEATECLVIDSATPLVAYDVTGSVTNGMFQLNEQVQQCTTVGCTTVIAQAQLMNTTSLGSFTDLELGPMWKQPSQTNAYPWVGQMSGAVFTPASTCQSGSAVCTPNPRMACARGLPGFGGARNPGCTSPNDNASMWELELSCAMLGPNCLPSGATGIFAGQDPVSTSLTNDCYGNSGNKGCWVNHIVLRDVEVTLHPGIAQSFNQNPPVNAARLIRVTGNPLGFGTTGTTTPCVNCQAVTHFGLERAYVHGWDPGDTGQPTSGSSVDSQGNCVAWDNSGTATVTNNYPSPSTVLLTNGYVGMTWIAGTQVYLGGTPNTPFTGTPYTIVSANPSANPATTVTVTSVSVSSPGSGMNIVYNQVNPPNGTLGSITLPKYTPGCGDDVEKGIDFNADNSWMESNYIEKIHWWGNESQAVAYGFSNGPFMHVNNWDEGGSESFFSGGGPVDQNGGPNADVLVARNYIGKDLNWRQLTGSAGNSPSPPWGCGTADGVAKDNTCPFSWAIKNDFENKLATREVVVGNIIENSWADAQQGFCNLINARTASGGALAGIFNLTGTSVGLPRTEIDNLRYESNWIRNCPTPFQLSNRSGNAGDGGGVSLPVQDNDFVNNLVTNISDTNQWNTPGTELEWTSGEDLYTCSMSRLSNVATATCLPYQQDITSRVTEVNSASSVVTVSDPERLDPILCSGSASTCKSNGQDIIVANHVASGALPGWSGSFAMTSTTGAFSPCGGTGQPGCGTGGNNVVYTDNINSPGNANLCGGAGNIICADLLDQSMTVSTVTCPGGSAAVYSGATNSLPGGSTGNGYVGWTPTITGLSNGNNGTFTVTASTTSSFTVTNAGCTPQSSANGTASSTNDITFASWGFSITDISPPSGSLPGDSIYASNVGGGDTSCSTYGYAVGATYASQTYAAAGTMANGLTVVYSNSGSNDSTSGAHCIINNGAGFPKFTTFQNNTILAVSTTHIAASNLWWLPISNSFFNNVFADNDSTHSGSDLTCATLNEGTQSGNAISCWDPNTFRWCGNVMTGRSGTYWITANTDPTPTFCSNLPSNALPQLASGSGGMGGANGGVNCPTSTATTNCLGYSGFMGASPTITYPSAACTYGTSPFDCPMMTLPWSSNFTLSDLSYVGSSDYSFQGVNTTTLQNAMTATEYTCPGGATCGTPGPYPY